MNFPKRDSYFHKPKNSWTTNFNDWPEKSVGKYGPLGMLWLAIKPWRGQECAREMLRAMWLCGRRTYKTELGLPLNWREWDEYYTSEVGVSLFSYPPATIPTLPERSPRTDTAR